jgi:hypothetical protein
MTRLEKAVQLSTIQKPILRVKENKKQVNMFQIKKQNEPLDTDTSERKHIFKKNGCKDAH